MTGEDLGERALARPIRAHDRVHLAGVDGEVDAREDLPSLDRGVEVLDLQQRMLAQPTLPSRLMRSEEHTSELQSRLHLVCRLLLEKKKKITTVSCAARHHSRTS